MSDELKKIIDGFIKEYEDNAIGEEMTELQKRIFRDAFLAGIDFAENTGTYL